MGGADPRRMCQIWAGGEVGSGYLWSPGLVLTAAHVVVGADDIVVVVGPDEPGEHRSPASLRWPSQPCVDIESDVAVLELTRRFPVEVPSVGVGRAGDADVVLDASAVGFPRWKIRRDGDGRFRDSAHVWGAVPVLSNRRTKKLEFIVPPPGRDPDPARSPWGGFSGAAVWVGERVAGIVSEHHPEEGLGRLTVSRLDTLLDRPNDPEVATLLQLLDLARPAAFAELVPAYVGERAHADTAGPLGLQAAIALVNAIATTTKDVGDRDRSSLPVRLDYEVDLLIAALVDVAVASQPPRSQELLEGLVSTADASPSEIRILCDARAVTSAPQLSAAIGQLHAIRREIERQSPSIAPRLRYLVSAPPSVVGLAATARQHWRATNATADPHGAFDRALHVSASTLADDHAVATLTNHFGGVGAREMVGNWRDHYKQAAGNPARALATVITTSVAELRGRSRPPVYRVLTSADQPPAEVEQRPEGLLSGQTPTLQHLRDGYFDPQTKRIEALAADLEARVGDAGAGPRVPFYWIAGPSGSGKSIALIQLMAHMNRDPNTTVVWIGDKPGLLWTVASEILRDHPAPRRVVFGLDDLFAYRHRADVIAGLESLSAAYGQSNDRPSIVVVCSGPIEHGIQFQDQSHREARVEIAPLSDVAKLDRGLFEKWLTERTGITPVAQYLSVDLPLEISVGWGQRAGVAEFGRRLKDRVVLAHSDGGATSVEAFFGRILAASQLGFGYRADSRELLSPEARDSLEAIAGDGHVVHTIDESGPSYKFAHGLLAHLVFDAWYDPRRLEVRTDLLEVAVAEGLSRAEVDVHRLEVIGPIIDALAAIPRSDTPSFKLDRVFASILQRTASTHETLSDDLLAALVPADIAAVDRALLPLAWSPIDEGIRRLQSDELPGWVTQSRRRLVTSMTKHGGDAGQDAAIGFASRAVALRGWETLVSHLIRQIDDRRLLDLVVRASELDTPLDVSLLSECLAKWADPRLLAHARDLLSLLTPSASAVTLAQAMHWADPDVSSTIVAWVRSWIARRHVGGQLAPLIELGIVPVPDALEWCRNHWSEQDAGPALARTFVRADQNQSLTDLIRRRLATRSRRDRLLVDTLVRWLGSNGENRSWSWKWFALPPADRHTDRCHELAVAWLAANPESSAWVGIWADVANSGRALVDSLITQAEIWLARRPDDRSGSIVRTGLLAITTGERQKGHAMRALDRLGADPSSVEWGYLLPAVLAVDDAAVRRRALDMAEAHASHEFDREWWSYVWRALAGVSPTVTIIHLAATWLEDPGRPGWRHVWLDLALHAPDHPRLQILALDWYRHNRTSSDVPAVLGRLAEISPSIADLFSVVLPDIEAGQLDHVVVSFLWERWSPFDTDRALLPTFRSWLRANGHSPSWWFLWSELVRCCASDPLDAIAIALETATTNEQRKFGISNRVSKVLAEAEPAVVQGASALLAARPGAPNWAAIWHAVRDLGSSDQLHAAAVTWLAEHSEHPEGQWIHVWTRLAKEGLDDALEALGRQWLASNGENKQAKKVIRLLDPLDGDALTAGEMPIDPHLDGHHRERVDTQVQCGSCFGSMTARLAPDRGASANTACPHCGLRWHVHRAGDGGVFVRQEQRTRHVD